MTTVKITHFGSAVIDNVPLQQFNNAVRRGNIVDDIIIINDIPYKYSSVEFVSSGGGATEIINIGSITYADLNAASGSTQVFKTFANAKPAGKRIVGHYSKVKTAFAGSGVPIPASAGLLSVISYFPANPMPNVPGFVLPFPFLSLAGSPANSSDQGDVKGMVNMVSSIPSGNPYTAGEIEFYLEVANFPDAVMAVPIS